METLAHIAGVVGAIVSFVLAVIEIKRRRPAAHISLSEFSEDTICVTIKNSSDFDILIKKAYIIFFEFPSFRLGRFSDENIDLRGKRKWILSPESEKRFYYTYVNENKMAGIGLFHWSPLSGAAIPRFPLVARLKVVSHLVHS